MSLYAVRSLTTYTIPYLLNCGYLADNAGCYHGCDFLLCVKKMYEDTGIFIKRGKFIFERTSIILLFFAYI